MSPDLLLRSHRGWSPVCLFPYSGSAVLSLPQFWKSNWSPGLSFLCDDVGLPVSSLVLGLPPRVLQKGEATRQLGFQPRLHRALVDKLSKYFWASISHLQTKTHTIAYFIVLPRQLNEMLYLKTQHTQGLIQLVLHGTDRAQAAKAGTTLDFLGWMVTFQETHMCQSKDTGKSRWP